MAKILTFRNKGDAPSGQGFLTDETQTLSFRTSEDGAVSLGDITQTGLPAALFPDPKKDWSNQELANLFRVRQLLGAANVPIETDRGVTDEGDPWFVFCHMNGEVFIHLCRIDGVYILDSPNVQRPLRGADFDELIADFTNQAMPAQISDKDTERRVVRFERGGKVRLHPSAMLAALIWTLFLASEELVLLAPEDSDADTDRLLDFDGMFAVNKIEDTPDNLILEDDTLDWDQMVKDGSVDADTHAADQQIQMRDTLHQQQGLTVQNNAFTMGLSTIAIAMGFMSETVLLDNQRKVLENLKELGFSEYGSDAQQVAQLDLPDDAEGGALLSMLAEFLGLDLSLNTELAEAANVRSEAAVAAEELANLSNDMGTDEVLVAAKATAPVVIRDKGADAEAEYTETPTELSPDVVDPRDTAEGEGGLRTEAVQDTLLQTLTEAVQNWSTLDEITVGHLTFKTSSGLSEEDAFALFGWIDTSLPEASTNYREFDSVASKLIEFLEAKDGDIYFLKSNNGVIMIDVSAQTGGETSTIHWEAEDGRTISFVGLQADFEQFDMIA
ncbi:hypothetical protein ACG74X_20355 [Marivita sp. S0852]|uniref:hypothetical protein n=1 Tax=Marivita sp. S0852 TaxID=3373893 RepID=UPI003981B699